MTWDRLEEPRHYGGPSVEAVAAQFQAELEEALANGYQPGALNWSEVSGFHFLDVTYDYDPARAPRPIQPVHRGP